MAGPVGELEAPKAAAPKSTRGLQILLVVLGLLTAWPIVTAGAANRLDSASPELALRFRAAQAEALLDVAQDAYDEGELAKARTYALRTLSAGPHTALAYRLLGQLEALEGRPRKAETLFGQARRLTHRDPALASLVFEQALADGRYDIAIEQAEVIIRRAPPAGDQIIARLAGLADEPAAYPALSQRLAEAPTWRPAFFRELARDSGNHPAALRLFSALTATDAPPRDEELAPVLNRMVWSGQAAQARAAWVATLPVSRRPGASQVYNPTFQPPGGAQMFDWELISGRGLSARLPDPGETPGLHVHVEGLEQGDLARQLLILEPGRYALSARGRLLDGSAIELRWRLSCGALPVGAPLALSLRSSASTGVSSELEVAACSAHTLTLETLSRDRGDPASAVVERVTLQRIGSA